MCKLNYFTKILNPALAKPRWGRYCPYHIDTVCDYPLCHGWWNLFPQLWMLGLFVWFVLLLKMLIVVMQSEVWNVFVQLLLCSCKSAAVTWRNGPDNPLIGGWDIWSRHKLWSQAKLRPAFIDQSPANFQTNGYSDKWRLNGYYFK